MSGRILTKAEKLKRETETYVKEQDKFIRVSIEDFNMYHSTSDWTSATRDRQTITILKNIFDQAGYTSIISLSHNTTTLFYLSVQGENG